MLQLTMEFDWARIILRAPETKNKLSVALLEELRTVLSYLRGRPTVQLVSIESASPLIFAAGADMNELLRLNPVTGMGYASLGQSVMRLVETMPAPVAALVSGPCFGGAFDLALSCDYIFASQGSSFCHPGAYLGIITGFGGTVRLPARIVSNKARHMLLTGQRLGAVRAAELRLVDRLFADCADMKAFPNRMLVDMWKWPKRAIE